MPKSNDYWQNRFIELEKSLNKYGVNSNDLIIITFINAQKEIQKEIDSWFIRVAENNKVSISDAKKLLKGDELKEFKWDVKEFIKYGEENDINPIWMKELENASARYNISRLDALKIRTKQVLEKSFGTELGEVNKMAKEVYTEAYYRNAYELQKGFNTAWDIGQIDERKLEKILSKPWAADGKDFSSRIWQSKTTMVNELHNELTRTCILGKAPDDAINTMSKFVNTKFKNAKSQAGNLVMTEQAYFSSAAQKDVFDDLDVEQYEIVATLDSHTSEICQNLDGEVFEMKNYDIGVTAPPFHPRCRTTTAPYFDDEFDLGERAARNDDAGKTYYVPSNIKYKEWKEKYVDGIV